MKFNDSFEAMCIEKAKRASYKTILLTILEVFMMKKKLIYAAVVFLMAGIQVAQANVISWAYANGKPIPADGFAGVEAVTNWNLTGNAGSANLLDNTAASTGVSLALAGGFGAWGIGGATSPEANGTYNKALFDGYYNSLGSTLTLSGISYARYNIIAYISSDGDGRTGTVSNGSTTFSFSTNARSMVDNDPSMTLIQTIDTGLGHPSANYAVFSNLMGANQTLTIANASDGMGFAGIQIVEDVSNMQYNSPANGATNIPIARTSPANDLVFTISGASITKVDVQFCLENDPNLTSKPAYKIVANLPVAQGQQYTVNLESLTADLSNDKTYYWKVIGYEPNETGFVAVPGPVSSFKTAPATALISAVSPAYSAVDAGQNVVLSVVGVSVSSYQWYKIGTVAPLVNGPDYTGVTTNTLTILDTRIGDEGDYYCIGSNSLPSSASNRDTGPGRVLTKRLTSNYPFEVMNVVDGNNVTPDVVGGFNMTVTQEAPSAGLPVLEADVAGAVLGTNSLKFDNLDNATDPNGQYALIANDVAKYEDITIALWVKYNGGNNWQRIYDFGKDTTSYMFLTPHADGAGLRFAITTGSGEQLLNAAALTEGEWTHVAVTIGGDTGRLYVNGKLVDTNTGMTLNPIAVIQTNNLVGKSQWNDAELNGLIDDLKIYDYARSTVEIAKDYLAVRGEYVCNMELTVLPYDYDGNCRIDLGDFAIFAATWLESNRITLP
jgi:hypothetical protein